MTKEQQDLIWACLPKEARDEIKGLFNKADSTNNFAAMGSYLKIFGKHNLTSDTAPSELLFVERKKVVEYCAEIKKYEPTAEPFDRKARYIGQLESLYHLFGDKCLPDKEPSVQVEPRFKIGDKVIVSHINTYFTSKVVEVNKIYPQFTYKLENLPDVWFAESLLEPYTEPETKGNTQQNSWDEDFKKMNECFEKIQKTLSSLCDTFCKLEANVNKLNRL